MGLTASNIKNEIAKFDRQAKASFGSLYEIKKQAILGKFEGTLFKRFPSEGPSEKYPFPKATPDLIRYDPGNIPTSDLDAASLTIENLKYGRRITIDIDFFEDMDRMPAGKAMYIDRIAGLSTRAINLPIKLMADGLLAQNDYANLLCWDGYALFSASHAGGSNLYDSNTAYTSAQLETDHNEALDLFCAMTDPDAHDILREEAPSKLVLLCDPKKITTYAQFYRAATKPAPDGTAAAVANVLGQSPEAINARSGIDNMGNTVNIIGWSRLRGKTKSFLIDVTDDLPGPGPLIWQERKAPKVVSNVGTGSDSEELAEQYWWKVNMRGGVGLGDFQKIVCIDKTS